MPVVFVFILGLILGSFLNAYIWRLRQGESAWRGRSYCPKCKKMLRWYELIPVVSFVAQRRRCRKCAQKIDWQYPLIELITGILFVAVLYSLNQSSNFKAQISNFGIVDLFRILIPWYLFAVLVILFVFDLRYGLVPDRVVLPAIIVAFVYSAIVRFELLAISYLLFATVVGAGFFAAQYYLSRGRWLGAGDIRIGALMGAMLGWPYIILGIVLSYFIGGAVGIILLLTRRKQFGQTLPLGTFLTLGTAIVFLYGEQIWNWYWR